MNFLMELGFDNAAVKLWLHFQAAMRGCKLQRGPYAWDLTKDARVIRIGRRQFASVGHLASHFDALFETLVASKTGRHVLLDFSRIHMHTYRASGVTFELAQWPEPEVTIESYFSWYQPRSSDLVFDLGAGCGVLTYILSGVTGNVIAFQPDARIRVILERNVVRHGLTNVTVTRDSIESLAELIGLYGQPVFCKVNLDEVTPAFLRTEAQAWTSLPIGFAAHSKSARVLSRFAAFLADNGFETVLDSSLGVLSGRQIITEHVAE
jgi:hypothetical protein